MTSSKIVLVIPMRTASQRIPEKIFADIQGRSLILRMADHALAFQESFPGVRCHLAVDSKKAIEMLAPFKGKLGIELTDPELPSGTDRVYSASKKIDSRADWIVNVQGDMPFIPRQSLLRFLKQLSDIGPEFSMATLAERFEDLESYRSPSVVKVLRGHKGESLYFSRLPIPYGREALPERPQDLIGLSHVGVYAYRPQALETLSKLPPHPLEKAEGLEQLRALANGIQIYCAETQADPGCSFRGIDVPADLAWARTHKDPFH
jgi:3-deoxy-manno-octulosonate cytidylyltransferase (CMP-KDO synthetase)